MTLATTTPTVADLGEVVGALREWQDDAAPVQLHPGDLGWFWQKGAEEVAAALRTWTRGGRVVAIGFSDGPVLRLTAAPDLTSDEASRIVTDLEGGPAMVETPNGSFLQRRLTDVNWAPGESWTPLSLDLAAAAPPDLRVEMVGPEQAAEFVAVHQSAWGSARFTVERWQTMAAGPLFADARCLLGRDERGVAVAGLTVWSAGPGRPGLFEPLGVHADHRGRGFGRAMCLAGAAALRDLGASTALVCTPTALVSAVATYESAGMTRLPSRLDRSRPA